MKKNSAADATKILQFSETKNKKCMKMKFINGMKIRFINWNKINQFDKMIVHQLNINQMK